jgi:chemotaxis protein CheD
MAGGSSFPCATETFKMGERNLRAATDSLALLGFSIHHRAVGGNNNQTLHLNVATGEITLKTPSTTETLLLAA